MGRCRKDHVAAEQRVQRARERHDLAQEDVVALTDAVHVSKADRDAASKQLANDCAIVEQLRKDWNSKLHERRLEVCLPLNAV